MIECSVVDSTGVDSDGLGSGVVAVDVVDVVGEILFVAMPSFTLIRLLILAFVPISDVVRPPLT